MEQSIAEPSGDFYMDVRQFSQSGLECCVKVILPMKDSIIKGAADDLSYSNYCKANGLPVRFVTKRFNDDDDDAERSQFKKETNQERAVRRSKQSVRFLTRELQADRLFTLTYRENMTDREQAKRDFQKFLRLVRKGWKGGEGCPDWQYVAVMEQQGRGAYHIHCAVKGWQRVNFLRAAWYKALGGTGKETGEETPGAVNVTSPEKTRWGKGWRQWKSAKLAAYLLKYIAKTFAETTSEKRRYWHSKGIAEPVKTRIILNATDMVSAMQECTRVLLERFGVEIDLRHSFASTNWGSVWFSIE